MIKFCYFNGKTTNLKQATLSIYDLGIMRGYGAFDFFRTYNGKIFHAKEHYARFKNSLKEIGLDLKISFLDFEKACYELMNKNKLKECSFRVLMTGGEMTDGLLSTKPNLIILCEPPYSPTKKDEENGIKIITAKYLRPFATSKTTCYIEAVRLEPKKRKAGATEILFIDNGKVFEFATSNIFIVKKGILLTPKNDVLKGITRKSVIDLAKKNKIKVIEKDISEKELYSADEVFLTATNKKVLPIVKIDSKKVSNGKAGQLTKKIQNLFNDYILNY
jgi:branched-chain amino acid aminotransferase